METIKDSSRKTKAGTCRARAEWVRIGQIGSPACPVGVGQAGRRNQGSAFTLIELLVVIGILAILLTLGAGFATSMLRDVDRKQTIARQKMLLQAIDAYHEEDEKYPPYLTGDLAKPSGVDVEDHELHASGHLLFCYLTGEHDLDVDGVVTADEDFSNTPQARAGRKILRLLDPQVTPQFKFNNVKYRGFLDAYDLPMRYEGSGGFGGRPVIISSGGQTGAEDRPDFQSEDAIRSDEH